MTDINPLDIVIPVLLLLYFLAGIRSGFFTTLGTFLGLGLGVCAAAWLVPLAVASVGTQWSLITAVGVLILCLTIGQWLGVVAGRTIRKVTDVTPLKGIERFFGGVLNLAACALVLVVLTISMRTVPIPQLNTALSQSKTLTWMVASTPDALKDQIDSVRNNVLASTSIPEVSELIAPEASAPTESVESDALDAASASVVRDPGRRRAVRLHLHRLRLRGRHGPGRHQRPRGCRRDLTGRAGLPRTHLARHRGLHG